MKLHISPTVVLDITPDQLPVAVTIGAQANTMAAAYGIPGGQFTVKADGNPLHPDDPAPIAGDNIELIEYVPQVAEPDVEVPSEPGPVVPLWVTDPPAPVDVPVVDPPAPGQPAPEE